MLPLASVVPLASEVTVCADAPLFVHVTVSPTATVRVAGVKAKFVMATAALAACAWLPAMKKAADMQIVARMAAARPKPGLWFVRVMEFSLLLWVLKVTLIGHHTRA